MSQSDRHWQPTWDLRVVAVGSQRPSYPPKAGCAQYPTKMTRAGLIGAMLSARARLAGRRVLSHQDINILYHFRELVSYIDEPLHGHSLLTSGQDQ
jgi:hypothetical protein